MHVFAEPPLFGCAGRQLFVVMHLEYRQRDDSLGTFSSLRFELISQQIASGFASEKWFAVSARIAP